jgi:hypothetical protein
MPTLPGPRLTLYNRLRNDSDILRGRLRLSENMLITAPRRSLHMRRRSSVRLALLCVALAAVRQGMHASAGERV